MAAGRGDEEGTAIDVYCLIGLPPGFAAADDLLGTRWEVPGAPVACALTLPRRPSPVLADWPGGRSLEAPDVGPATNALHDRWSRWLDDGDRLWGVVFYHDAVSHRVLGTTVHYGVAVASFDGDVSAAEDTRWAFVEAVSDAAARWLDEVRDWAEVGAGRLIRADTPDEPGPTTAQMAAQYVDETGSARRFADYRKVHIAAYREPWALTRADFAAAVRRVRVGIAPAFAHLLLRDARLARFRGDPRRAVIDAASACEVALSTAIRNSLAVMPSPALDALLDRLNGVIDLYRYHARALAPITAVSERRLNDRLAGVRNRVAHDGEVPTPTETAEVIEVASALVAELSPLPPSGD